MLGFDGDFMSLLPDHPHAESARRVLAFARDMHAAAATVNLPGTDAPVRIRIGIHTGTWCACSGLKGQTASRLPHIWELPQDCLPLMEQACGACGRWQAQGSIGCIAFWIGAGPVMSGVVGSKLPKFALFGDS